MSLGQGILIHLWTKVATDIFYFDSDSYLLIFDYTSRFPVVKRLTSMTVQHVTSQMKLVFSEYGLPETIISNNGPCYSAEAFTKLMRNYSVNHIISSPNYPQLSGLAEKYVQIVKNLFYKSQEEGDRSIQKLDDLQKHPTIKPVTITYAVSTFTNCKVITPYVQCSQKTTWAGPEQLRVKSKNEQLPTHDLHIGQSLMYQDPVTKRWHPATIASLYQEHRSYRIRTKDGISHRKTQNHLKPYQPQHNKGKMNNCNM